MKTAAEKTTNEKKGKLLVFIVDLKAAFDDVRREKLWEYLREKGIRSKVMNNIVKICRETKSKLKIGNKYTESFWTEKGIRQSCPLSPLFLILFIADIEYLREKQEGAMTIGNKRVYALAYANDQAITAET